MVALLKRLVFVVPLLFPVGPVGTAIAKQPGCSVHRHESGGAVQAIAIRDVPDTPGPSGICHWQHRLQRRLDWSSVAVPTR